MPGGGQGVEIVEKYDDVFPAKVAAALDGDGRSGIQIVDLRALTRPRGSSARPIETLFEFVRVAHASAAQRRADAERKRV